MISKTYSLNSQCRHLEGGDPGINRDTGGQYMVEELEGLKSGLFRYENFRVKSFNLYVISINHSNKINK